MFRFNNQFRPYTPDTISRNIKQVKNGVIELCRYSDAKFKQFIWLWIIAIIFFGIYDSFTDNIVRNRIIWFINPDNFLKLQYEELIKTYVDMGKSLSNLGTYKEFKQEMISGHTKISFIGLFFILCPVILFSLLALPNWRPLRIDTNRRLIYFWLFGKFYITRYYEKGDPLKKLAPYSYQSRLTLPEHAALVLTIPHETDPNNVVRVDLGIYRPACDYQDQVLKAFLTDYMRSPNPDEEFAPYFKKENRLWSDYINFFYHFSLFPTRGYNEKKTEAKIQAWLVNNPEILEPDEINSRR